MLTRRSDWALLLTRHTLGPYIVLDVDGRIVGSYEHVDEAFAGLRALGVGTVVRRSDWALLQTRQPRRKYSDAADAPRRQQYEWRH